MTHAEIRIGRFGIATDPDYPYSAPPGPDGPRRSDPRPFPPQIQRCPGCWRETYLFDRYCGVCSVLVEPMRCECSTDTNLCRRCFRACVPERLRSRER